MLSVVLVTLVVFLFLRSARATVIPSVAVPLSLVGTFGVMYLLGYSLDNLSLMALTISTGFVVDDAIVVTENIARFIEDGQPPLRRRARGREADRLHDRVDHRVAHRGLHPDPVHGRHRRAALPRVRGHAEHRHRDLGARLADADADDGGVPAARARPAQALAARTTSSERVFDGAASAATSAAHLGARPLGAHAARDGRDGRASPSGWPSSSRRASSRSRTPGCSRASPRRRRTSRRRRCSDRQKQVNAIVQRRPRRRAHGVVHRRAERLGQHGHGLRAAQAVRPAQVDRRRRHRAPAPQARARSPGITLFLQSVQDLRIGGRGSRTQYQYTLQDANLDELRTWAPRVLEGLRKLPELRDVNTDQQTAGLELDVTIDRDTAARLGITHAAPSTTRSTTPTASARSRRRTRRSNYYRVVLEAKPEYQTGPDAARRASTCAVDVGRDRAAADRSRSSATGLTPLGDHAPGAVPVGDALVQPGARQGARPRRQGHRRARAQDRHAGEHQRRLLRARRRPSARRSRASPCSSWRRSSCVYLVLGILYESLVHPLTILSTLPSAAVGALIALLVAQARLQHHRAHRRRAAARHREEERHHDDRLRARGGARREASSPRTRSTARACCASGRS